MPINYLSNHHPDFETLMALWEERAEFLADWVDDNFSCRDSECEVYDRVTKRMMEEK